MTAAEPDVSVIVISYNDGERLARAIASVQRQTLRNLEIVVVDDASSDDTAAVVQALAADDPRIRYECLPVNSGGCSAPRNRGVEIAQAPWIMFCDSDDEYERHACKNLLLAAERLGADVVCGTAERVDVRTGRTKRWRPEVHESERVADALEDFPELLFDTISVNKIYRRKLLAENGISFPEGLLFEDQLFTLEAFAAAQRLAVIPEVVYRWNVDRLSDEPSITQRRHEAHNVESRIEINRRIDAFLAARGLTAIQELKDLKFLKHDLYLYLSSMLVVDDETAQTLIDRLVPYVSSVNLSPAWQVRPALRVAIYHLLIDDLSGVRAAMRFVKWAAVVDMSIVGSGGREMWACEHLEDGPDAGGYPARAWLDVTALHLLTIPFTQRRYLHRIDELTISAAGVVSASGSTVDYDGSLSTVDPVELRFLIDGGRTAISVPTGWTGRDRTQLTWQADGAPIDGLGRALAEKDRGTLGLAVTHGDHVNVASARCDEDAAPSPVLAFPGRVRRDGPDSVELGAHEFGTIGWRSVRASSARSLRSRMYVGWLRVPGAAWLARSASMVREAVVPRATHRLGSVLPSRKLVLFESDGGRTAGGNPRSLSEYLHEHHPDVAQAWVWRDYTDRVPGYAQRVERLSLRHVWLAARARYWVDDGTAPLSIAARASGTVVNAGEGVPIRRKGLDDPSVLVSRAEVREVRRRSRRWTLLLAASDYDARVTGEALGYRGRTEVTGLVRADAALPVQERGSAQRLRGKVSLDLPTDRPTVLYAPARRDAGPSPSPLLDVEAWADRLGDRCYLLMHRPASEKASTPTRLRFAVRDTGGADADLLVAAADLVICDYSTLIGDAALAGVPMIAFQPDRDVYVNRTHGLYPGSEAVGPVVVTMDALLDQVEAWLTDPQGWDVPYAARRAAFARDRCGPADGRSAGRAAAAMLGSSADRGRQR